MLRLGHWDPLRPQKKLIEQLKTFLEVCCGGAGPRRWRACWVWHLFGRLGGVGERSHRAYQMCPCVPAVRARACLQTNARVDLEEQGSELNNISRYPSSSYRPVHRLLAQLEALTGARMPSLSGWWAGAGTTGGRRAQETCHSCPGG